MSSFLEKDSDFLTSREQRCLSVLLNRSMWLVSPVSLPTLCYGAGHWESRFDRHPSNRYSRWHFVGKMRVAKTTVVAHSPDFGHRCIRLLSRVYLCLSLTKSIVYSCVFPQTTTSHHSRALSTGLLFRVSGVSVLSYFHSLRLLFLCISRSSCLIR